MKSDLNVALILSGGVGSRMNMGSFPKQYLLVNDRPIIDYCLHTFEQHPLVHKIVIVADCAWREYIDAWIHKSNITKFACYTAPGETRQMSIFNGLVAIEDQLPDTKGVIIHDAARPLVPNGLIDACLKGLAQADAVMPVLPVKDTCYQSLDGKTISGFLPRSQLFAGQAPEAFQFAKYLNLHRSLPAEYLLQISGSSELVYKNGWNVQMVPGSERNFKITTQDDLKLLERYLQSEE